MAVKKKVFFSRFCFCNLHIKYSFVKLKHSHHYISYVKLKMTRRGTILVLETCFGSTSIPCSDAFEKCTTKTELFNGKRYTKKLYTKLQPQMPLHVSAQLRIVTPPRFREKPFYVKLTTFSTAQGTKNQIKPIADPKSTLKINMRSRWTVFQILLMSAVICI